MLYAPPRSFVPFSLPNFDVTSPFNLFITLIFRPSPGIPPFFSNFFLFFFSDSDSGSLFVFHASHVFTLVTTHPSRGSPFPLPLRTHPAHARCTPMHACIPHPPRTCSIYLGPRKKNNTLHRRLPPAFPTCPLPLFSNDCQLLFDIKLPFRLRRLSRVCCTSLLLPRLPTYTYLPLSTPQHHTPHPHPNLNRARRPALLPHYDHDHDTLTHSR
ncbi:hypothetical protein BDZ97DRAFT_1160095 [Flammula alnicola]|nr:hypothetical protein BDZ97DRAFT_1160095 [Flammula alnicola]